MFICGTSRAYFVVYTQKGMSVEIIHKDEEFCSKMITKLENFYFGSLLPEILDSRRSRNLPLRNFYLT